MPEIVLTEEQAEVVRASDGVVAIRGPDGRAVGLIDPTDPTDALVAEAIARRDERRRNPRPGVPAAKVHASLVALQAEWERVGGFDVEYAHAFMLRHQAGRE